MQTHNYSAQTPAQTRVIHTEWWLSQYTQVIGNINNKRSYQSEEIWRIFFYLYSYLFMDVNHDCILLWRMSSWVQHTGRHIWWVKGSWFFYCLLLSIRKMVVFILTNGIMSRQSISPCSLASNRRAINNQMGQVLYFEQLW